MKLPVIHDPDAAVCRCTFCCETRWRDAQEAQYAAQLAREQAETITRAEREYQLRLPMAPLPHCAGQPRALARAHAAALLQPECER